MANSRKSHSLNNSSATDLIAAFERALEAILARVVVSSGSGIAVAYSGGLDSSVLLALLAAYCRKHQIPLFAFHIHHGLSPNADAWQSHCAKMAAAAGAHFAAQSVALSAPQVHGIEQAARLARYAALGVMCRAHRLPLLLTAHHQTDQAETVLMQLFRGAGLPGLSGMATLQEQAALLGGDVALGRPLLDFSRVQLEGLAQIMGLESINDESNADIRFRRNAVRHRISPVVESIFPAFSAALTRSSRHLQSAQSLLDELAAMDLPACRRDGGLDLAALAQLSARRIDNSLRFWLQQQGLRAPSTAQLSQLHTQMLLAAVDSHPRIRLDDCILARQRGLLVILPYAASFLPPSEPVYLQWRGETVIEVPVWQGRLLFEQTAEPGLDSTWLSQAPLRLVSRSGSERLRLATSRPSRSLKNLFQEAGIQAAERPCLPVLMAGPQLVFVAGLGMEVSLPQAAQGVRLHWQKRPLAQASDAER